MGETLKLGEALQQLTHLSSHAVLYGLVLCFPIPPLHGPLDAFHRLLHDGCASTGDPGMGRKLFDEPEELFHAPPDVGAELGG